MTPRTDVTDIAKASTPSSGGQLVPAYRHATDPDVLKQWADLTGDGYGNRLNNYTLFDDYYSGKHRAKLNARAAAYLKLTHIDFAENVCDVVVDSAAERMEVTGFVTNLEADIDVEEPRPITDALAQVWEDQKLDVKQGDVHTGVRKLGDWFVLVDVDPDTRLPRITSNHPGKLRPIYHAERPDELVAVVKRWDCSDVSPTNPSGRRIRRLNLYFDDRVEKYFQLAESSLESTWAQHVDEGDVSWPVPWTVDGTPGGKPRGIPVVHFRNKSKGQPYGVSDLLKVIPQQDQLNKHILDLNDIVDYQAWPQRWGTGIANDEVGRLNNHPGEFWAASAVDAKFGAFPAADLSQMQGVIESDLQRIAGLTRTPIRFLVLAQQPPSGEAIRAGDAGLVGKVRDAQPATGHGWEQVLLLCARILADEGHLQVADDVLAKLRVTVAWRDAEARGDKSDWEVAGAQQAAGVSVETTLRERGYDPVAEAKRREQEAEALQDRSMRAKNRGLGMDALDPATLDTPTATAPVTPAPVPS